MLEENQTGPRNPHNTTHVSSDCERWAECYSGLSRRWSYHTENTHCNPLFITSFIYYVSITLLKINEMRTSWKEGNWKFLRDRRMREAGRQPVKDFWLTQRAILDSSDSTRIMGIIFRNVSGRERACRSSAGQQQHLGSLHQKGEAFRETHHEKKLFKRGAQWPFIFKGASRFWWKEREWVVRIKSFIISDGVGPEIRSEQKHKMSF